MGDADTDGQAPAEPVRRDPLPEPIRARVIGWASDTLGELADAEVPLALRRVARFAPARRAKVAGSALAAAVESDEGFRRRVQARVRAAQPDLCASLDRGSPPAAADPVDVAAASYVLRPDGWTDLLSAAEARVAERTRDDRADALAAQIARLEAEVAAVRARAAEEVRLAREEAATARDELAALRRELRDRIGGARRAEEEARAARQAAEAALAAREEDLARTRADARRTGERLAEVEAALAAERRAVREGRTVADRDARLLLDTLLGAARGLERELALPPALGTPADDVASAAAGAGAGVDVGGGLAPDDPALLERLLTLPRAHLVVDAYNVTKTAYGDLPLVDQRRRLVSGLAGLAARTSAEVTAVFDGAAVATAPASWPRGVRVVFSDPGETADALVLRLVAAEPVGRVVVVVSSDREVVTGAVARGARAIPSGTLARLLERG